MTESLNKVLRPIDLWAVAVGLVISGEYFGWSYGFKAAGTVGFLSSTLLIAIMYTALVFSMTELTTAIPHAGGPFVYVERAFGHRIGVLAGLATLMEFLFAPPAIAFALGSYLHFIVPEISISAGAMIVLAAFMVLNLFGVKQAVRFELVVTVIAVVELLVFIALVLPHFRLENFLAHTEQFNWTGIFSAIPYAIWFFLAIEGVAMAAEEVKNPSSTVPKGYLSAIATLVFLAFGVMLAAGGVGDWRVLSTVDYPVPQAMAMALGTTHWAVRLFAGIGLFGLVASLNGIVFSASRIVFALGRARILPQAFANLSARDKTPRLAVIASCAVGFIGIAIGHTSQLITLSAMGAVIAYVLTMASVIKLRRQEPNLARPYRVPWYPVTPLVALTLALVSLGALVYFNLALTGWLLVLLLCSFVLAPRTMRATTRRATF